VLLHEVKGSIVYQDQHAGNERGHKYQSIKRSFRFRAPLALALTSEKMTAARAPRSLKFFRAPLALALTNEMSGAHFALVF
jgi:hypothetical protein